MSEPRSEVDAANFTVVPSAQRRAIQSDQGRIASALKAIRCLLGLSTTCRFKLANDGHDLAPSKPRPPIDHVHGPLHGVDAEPVQKLLEGLTFQASRIKRRRTAAMTIRQPICRRACSRLRADLGTIKNSPQPTVMMPLTRGPIGPLCRKSKITGTAGLTDKSREQKPADCIAATSGAFFV